MLTISAAAQTQLDRLLVDLKDREKVGLRVYVTPGGCSGFSYGMGFDEPAEGDEVIPIGATRLLVDAFSQEYLNGSEVDYVDSLMGGGFTVHNPNAVKTCSCGSSFDADSGSEAPKPCSH
jgi:iron-sulfur cluster assembly protein